VAIAYPWLALWAAEEIRIDSDQERLNQNDVGAGIRVVAGGAATLRLFFDLESTHRNLRSWKNTGYIGLAIGFRAGRSGPTTIPAAPASHDLGHD